MLPRVTQIFHPLVNFNFIAPRLRFARNISTISVANGSSFEVAICNNTMEAHPLPRVSRLSSYTLARVTQQGDTRICRRGEISEQVAMDITFVL